MTRDRQRVEIEVAQVDAVDLDRPVDRVVQPAQQLRQGRLAGSVLADDRQRAAGGDGEVEPLEHVGTRAGIGERDVSEVDVGSREPGGGSCAVRQRADGGHRAPEPRHRGGGRGRPVERPAETAERDRARADRGLHVDDDCLQVEAAVDRAVGESPEDQRVGGHHDRETTEHWTLAQPRGPPLELVQSSPPVDEPVDDPVGEPEQAHLLGGRRIDGEAIGVVGMALRVADLVRVAVAPDRALAQHPMGRTPPDDEDDRRPPREPEQHERRGESADELDEAAGDEVHRDAERRSRDAEIEVARHREVVDQDPSVRGGRRPAARYRRPSTARSTSSTCGSRGSCRARSARG